ncbi:MAG TPA: hypothetical protein VEC13_00405, partial [Candidatus Paceibacterota bacterium]|nr:hypothetical protein [Candidatus Paceibacterota bacterium]
EVTDKEVDDVISQFTKHYAKEGEEAPELTDEFVKTLGDFQDVTDLKTKIKDNLFKEKEMQATSKRRSNIIGSITKEAKVDVPASLIERELDQMIHEFTYELSRMGQTLENYTTHAKKTEEDIRNEWREKAANRVAQELVLQKIAEAEKLEPNKEEVEKEVNHMLEHYPNTPKERVVSFVEDMQLKQQVFKLLEE